MRHPEPPLEDNSYREFREPSATEKRLAAEHLEGEFYAQDREAIVTVADYLPCVLDVARLTMIAKCNGMRSRDISDYIWEACKEYVESWETEDWAHFRGET